MTCMKLRSNERIFTLRIRLARVRRRAIKCASLGIFIEIPPLAHANVNNARLTILSHWSVLSLLTDLRYYLQILLSAKNTYDHMVGISINYTFGSVINKLPVSGDRGEEREKGKRRDREWVREEWRRGWGGGGIRQQYKDRIISQDKSQGKRGIREVPWHLAHPIRRKYKNWQSLETCTRIIRSCL